MRLNQPILTIAGFLTASIVGHVASAQVCDAPLLASARGKVKFQPGHYVAIGSGPTVATRLTTTLAEISATDLNTKVVGVQKRYYWSDLNGPGQYDWHFEQLRKDIDEVGKSGKKLSVMIMFKFSSDSDASPVPEYVRKLPAYTSGGLSILPVYDLNADGDFADGQIAHFGHPSVRKHFIRFLTKLAAEIDNSNVVSNVVLPESAMGVKAGKAPYASMTSAQFAAIRDSHIDGLLAVDQQAACLLKHTPLIQLTNYPVVKLPELAAEYKDWSVGMGGPDVWIDDDDIEASYKYFPQLEPYLPIGLIVAGGNYNYVSHKAETVEESQRASYTLQQYYGWASADVPSKTVIELAKKARTLGVNYLFWKKNGDKGDKYYQAFKTEIAKMGTSAQTILPTFKVCPSNYTTSGTGCVATLP
jgi:hypothetical protein